MYTCIVEQQDALTSNPADAKNAESLLTKTQQCSPSQQNITKKTSSTTANTSTSSTVFGTTNQRRTTSLLNIFSSNSQGMLITQFYATCLRSIRSKSICFLTLFDLVMFYY